MSADLYQEFQEILLSDNPNYATFIPKVLYARKATGGVERIQLAAIERLASALKDFSEQRSGISDLSILIRQYIRINKRKLKILTNLWLLISSKAQEFDLWGSYDSNGKSVEISVNPWNPTWLDITDDFDRPEIRRMNSSVIGDGLLFAATGKSTYLSQAQKNAVLACLTLPPGETILISLPTGAGKSLCILLPSWQDSHGGRKSGGTTLVIVPTIALAFDQERRSMEYFPHSLSDEYKPWSLTGSTPIQNREIIRKGLREGTLPLLFTSPESLIKSEIYDICIGAAEKGFINRIVIDEAHIIETWGADFRAEFQYLAAFRRSLINRSPIPPSTILLSATITRECETLLRNLFSETNNFHFMRGNSLRAEISFWFSNSESKELRKKRIFEAVRHLPRPMILFVNKPTEAEELTTELRKEGFNRIAAFSGNTSNDERARILAEWDQNQRDLIVATSAFGLGIDKEDVRAVLHAAFPESIDRFYQEVGRGGRDGIGSLSLVCAAEGDSKEALKIIKSSRITTEKAISRWEAMQSSAKILPPREMVVDLNTKPNYNQDIVNSERHRDWNIHVLLMMERAKLIRIIESNIIPNLEVPTNNHNMTGGSIDYSFLIKLEILDVRITNDKSYLKNKINLRRMAEVSGIRKGLGRFIKLVDDYSNNQTNLCISKSLSKLYPAVSESCGGCPACRRINRNPYSTTLGIEMDLSKMNVNPAKLDQRLQAKLNAHNVLNIFWEEPECLDHFKNKFELFSHLVQMGVQQFILPDAFFDDSSWMQKLCFSFSDHFQSTHQVLPHRSVGSPEKFFIPHLTTMILYPEQENDAEFLFQGLEELFVPYQNVFRINVFRRGLVIPSLAGLFVDKINGLNESLRSFEESLSEQFGKYNF